jgi:hypothetical protein
MSITATAPEAAVEPQKVVVDVAREGEGLDRRIGFLGLLWTSVGSIIGSGWLFGALIAATVAGP